MTKIKKLSIKNFKAFETLEFSPKAINLITGRNNTGKTSLLESINFLFNPAIIRIYGSNHGKLIRANNKSCTISANIDNKKTKLEIIAITPTYIWEEYLFYFIDRFVNYVKEYSKRGINYSRGKDLFSSKDFERSFKKALEEQLQTISPDDVIFNPLLLRKDGKDYPYIVSRLDRQLDWRKVIEKISEDIKFEEPFEKEFLYDLFRMNLARYPMYYGLGSRNGFIRGHPEKSDAVRFIRILDPDDLAEDEEKERVALKVDDIGDYIKEKKLVKNLKTFGLDQLVFEKGREKYAVPFDFMGNGFKSMVGILWHLLEGEYKKKIVLIEEPENNMHPGYIKEFVYFLIDVSQKYNIQFFITTHDRDFIESFFSENITQGEKNFLKENFYLINLRDDFFQDFDYDQARYHVEELLKDLRGI